MNENDFMGDFEILRHQYILDKKHLEDSSEEFARKCFKVARSCGVINKYAKLLEYSFKDWNITLIYTVQDKKYGLIFDYTDGDIDNIITSLKKGLYDRIWYTKKRS